MWGEVWGMHRVKWETRGVRCTEYGVKNGIVVGTASY